MARDGNVATKCKSDLSEISQNILACVCKNHLWIITMQYCKCNRGRSIYRLGKNLCARLQQHQYLIKAFVLREVNPSPWLSVTYLMLLSLCFHPQLFTNYKMHSVLGVDQGRKESFVFLGELLRLILESQKPLEFSSFQRASDACYHTLTYLD